MLVVQQRRYVVGERSESSFSDNASPSALLASSSSVYYMAIV